MRERERRGSNVNDSRDEREKKRASNVNREMRSKAMA